LNVLIEIFKSAHFLCFFLFLLGFSLWIREEFFTIFNRKKIATFSIIKVLFLRLLTEDSGFQIEESKNKTVSLFLYVGTAAFAIIPLFFVQITDRFDFLGQETYLGLSSTNESWLYFFTFLTIGEIFRSLYDSSYKQGFVKITLMFCLMLTFINIISSFSIEQMVQFQKSFNENGIRNYFLLVNHLGLFFMGALIYTEIENPKNKFNLINHLYLNTYIVLFIYGFLGGFGLPSILEGSKITPGLDTIIFQNLSVLAKFIFTAILIWVLKFSLIKTQRRINVSL
jgi:heme/copper-type cytochrome/quinol oxidase subunit 3